MTARRWRHSLLSTATCALIAVGFVIFPLRSWGGGQVSIPRPGQGYEITRTQTSQEAPAGYEGRTDTTTQTAVGNTPVTEGKRILEPRAIGYQLSKKMKCAPGLTDSPNRLIEMPPLSCSIRWPLDLVVEVLCEPITVHKNSSKEEICPAVLQLRRRCAWRIAYP
jgi:hypothetical protein